MFRYPRRIDRTISDDEGKEILKNNTWGVLGTISEDGYPYTVPLSFVYAEKENSIYFHCAAIGHKVDNIDFCNKVSFTVVGKTKVQPELFSTLYESVVIFGICTQIFDNEKINAFKKFIQKYNPDGLDQVEHKIALNGATLRVYKITIQHITAKSKKLQ